VEDETVLSESEKVVSIKFKENVFSHSRIYLCVNGQHHQHSIFMNNLKFS